mgnify:FL=1
MSWKEIKKLYSIAINSYGNKTFDHNWNNFTHAVISTRQEKNLGMRLLVNSLGKVKKEKNNIYILDHGCGSGLKAMCLYALGYKNIFGVNVNDGIEVLNEIIKKKNKKKINHFYKISGEKLPFRSEKFDFIYSCQVVEHVTDDMIDNYYSEEGRVLKRGGYAYHEVPHLLVPYDSHSRLWFVHWAPSFMKPFFYGLLKSIQNRKFLIHKGKELARKFNGEFLCLRSPYFHKNKLKKYIGKDIFEEDLTNRIISKKEIESYDSDAPSSLRRIISILLTIPLLNRFLNILLKNFMMLHTLTKK